MSDKNYELEIELGILRMKAAGEDKAWVEQMMDKYFAPAVEATTKIANRHTQKLDNPNQLTLFDNASANTNRQEDDAPALKEQHTTVESTPTKELTLREFYHKLVVEGQSDEIAAIAYWHKHHQNAEALTGEIFLESYKQLAYFGVDTPDGTGLNNRIQNARKAGYIYRVEYGHYAISKDGEDRVHEMLQAA